eukprot:GHVT01095486.1.p1 GENE.GHVT01095486.1~~GHVT01095486.1.p1  ORF type:complete len:271 (-),score=8.43 GHVT01095486.1:368-1180(-)
MSVVPPVNPQWFTTQRESPSKISAAGQKAAVSAASVPFVVDVGGPAASSAPPTGSFEDFQECLHWKATDTLGNTSVVARHFKRRLGLTTWNRCTEIIRHWYPAVVALVLVVSGIYFLYQTNTWDKGECGDKDFIKLAKGDCLVFWKIGKSYLVTDCEARKVCEKGVEDECKNHVLIASGNIYDGLAKAWCGVRDHPDKRGLYSDIRPCTNYTPFHLSALMNFGGPLEAIACFVTALAIWLTSPCRRDTQKNKKKRVHFNEEVRIRRFDVD